MFRKIYSGTIFFLRVVSAFKSIWAFGLFGFMVILLVKAASPETSVALDVGTVNFGIAFLMFYGVSAFSGVLTHLLHLLTWGPD